MVESEAQELSEDVMLGAVDVRPRALPAGDPGDHRAGRACREGALGAARAVRRGAGAEGPRRRAGRAPASPRPTRRPDKQARHDKVGAAKKAGHRGADRRGAGRRRRPRACSRTWKPTSSATPSSTPACASTAATPRPSARSSPRSACCRARTARRCSPAARRRRSASPRWAPARTSRSSTRSTGEYREHFMLHYNFPPYSVGEAGRMGSPGPARDRPRQAGLARDPSAAAGEGQVPLHDARRLRDHRVATARPRWRPSAAPRWR